jgi:septum formation protein
VKTGEPLDKAGAYAVQGLGGRLVAEVDGCLSNVIGLPVSTTRQLLTRWGIG